MGKNKARVEIPQGNEETEARLNNLLLFSGKMVGRHFICGARILSRAHGGHGVPGKSSRAHILRKTKYKWEDMTTCPNYYGQNTS